MTVYKINFSGRDSIETSLIYRTDNTKNLFDNCIDSYYCNGKKILEACEMTEENLFDLVNSGKIAVYPIHKSIDTFNVCNIAKMGIIPYLMQNKAFNQFKENYIKNFIEADSLEAEEMKQKELF